MAWTTLPTYSAGAVLTAAQMNAIAANINETSAATVTTAGDMTYADAANSMGNRLAIGSANSFMVSTGSAPVWRTINEALGDATYSGTPSSYAQLDSASWGSGTAVVVTITTGTAALVMVNCLRVSTDSAGGVVTLSYSISGATTLAAASTQGVVSESGAANDQHGISVIRLETLTAGSNTFEVEAQVSAGTATIARPRLLVMAL